MMKRLAIFGLVLLNCLWLCSCSPSPELQSGEPDVTGATLWTRFAVLTDVHVLDEESPARFIRMDGVAGMFNEAWRPQEAYVLHGLDSAVRMLNAYHHGVIDSGAPLYSVWVLGDVTDNAHRNELGWFVDVMDGKRVTADSGALDGGTRPVPPEQNPKLAFQSAGLDIPWYVVRGNHDALCAGVFPLREDASGVLDAPIPGVVAWLIGLWEVVPFGHTLSPTASVSPAVVTGSGPPVDPVSLQLDKRQLRSGSIVPDGDRRFLTKRDFISAFLASTSEPLGHGFTFQNLVDGSARYSVRPDPDVPLRFVVLDTAAEEAPLESFSDFGVMTQEQFDRFLVPALSQARAQGEFVIVVSHHPSTDFDRPYPRPTVGTWFFRQYLAWQPHVLAHLCGHTHAHKITVIDGKYPYVEVETASLIDLPQEMRIVEAFYEENTRKMTLVFRVLHFREMATPLGVEFIRRAEADAAAGVVYTQPIGDQVFYIELQRSDFVPAVDKQRAMK